MEILTGSRVAISEVQRMRRCYICKERKILEEFSKDRNKPLGRGYRCRLCNAAKTTEYRQKYPERARATQKVWYAKYGAAWARHSRRENPDKSRIACRKYAASHRERERERNREYDRVQRVRRKGSQRKTTKGFARQSLKDAVYLGKIIKPKSCPRCKSNRILHGHHYDGYENPYKVAWLCSVCHGLEHRKPVGTPIAQKVPRKHD